MSKRIREQNDTQNAATAPQKEPKKTASTEAQPLALSGAQRAIPVVLFALAIFVTLLELPLLYRKMSASERTALAKQVLERVGLSHRMKHMPTQLSGGQCQRVAIARAIVGNPEIILADEPTGNLDSKMGAEVMDLLHKLNREDGRTIVMVTHNEAQAKQTNRIVHLFDGRQVK